MEKKSIIDRCTSDLNDEYLRFREEIEKLEGNSNNDSENSNESEADSSEEEFIEEAENELNQILTSMIGDKCRAPFIQEWGEKAYHNAIILDATHNADVNEKEITVLVMFSNPMCDAMNPCPYFLDGQCKFSDDKCRYSHGYSVKYSELEEYVLPDYSSLTRDSRCLAKYDDGLWHIAIVENCLNDNKYVVKYERYGNVETLSAEDIIPFENLSISQSNDHDDEENELENTKEYELASTHEVIPHINYEMASSSSALGSWEQHTKGIGSKLMAKMGYVTGQGLGKNSDGRIEPVEAMVLPKGKSLDKCAEIRQNTGLNSVEEKFNNEQLKEQKRAKNLDQKYNENSNKHTVFDFINKKVFGNSDGQNLIRKRDLISANEEMLENKELNLKAFKIGEDIKKTKKEICKLQHFLKRNSNRNYVACIQIEQKLAAQNTHLRKLENQEKKIEEMNVKNKKMKLTF